MKKSALLILALFLVFQLNAQFHLGIRGGLSSSQVKISETVNGIKVTTGDNKFGYHIGAFSQIIFKDHWVIMPEVLFTSSGGSIDLSDGMSFREVWDLTYNRIEIPVTLGYKFLKILRIQAGVVPGFMLKADARSGDLKEEVTQNYKNATWAYQAGLGVDFWLISADLKYQGNFKSIHNNNITIPGTEIKVNPDTRLNMWVLSLGIRIF